MSYFLVLINLAILVIIVVVLVNFSSKILFRLSVKRNIFIISGYLVLLIMLSVACFLLPSNQLLTTTEASIDDSYGVLQMYPAILKNDFGNIEGCTRAEYNFAPQGNSVTIKSDSDLSWCTYVGTKGVDAPDNGDGKIDVYSYSYASVVIDNSTSFDIPVDPLLFSFNQDNLILTYGENRKLDYACFSDRLSTAGQFFDADSSSDSRPTSSQIVIILLPPGVTCTNNADVQSLSQLNELS